jgi:hypothetical protein
MGVISELGLKPGVITGDDVLHVLPSSTLLTISYLSMLASINLPFLLLYTVNGDFN